MSSISDWAIFDVSPSQPVDLPAVQHKHVNQSIGNHLGVKIPRSHKHGHNQNHKDNHSTLNNNQYRLHISNLPTDITSNDLSDTLSELGTVNDIVIHHTQYINSVYAYANINTLYTANTLLHKSNQLRILNQTLQVEFARPDYQHRLRGMWSDDVPMRDESSQPNVFDGTIYRFKLNDRCKHIVKVAVNKNPNVIDLTEASVDDVDPHTDTHIDHTDSQHQFHTLISDQHIPSIIDELLNNSTITHHSDNLVPVSVTELNSAGNNSTSTSTSVSTTTTSSISNSARTSTRIVDWMGSNSDADDDIADDYKRFQHQPGVTNAANLQLKSTFNNDDRFVLGSGFADSDHDNDIDNHDIISENNAHVNDKHIDSDVIATQCSTTDTIDIDDEKLRQLDILADILVNTENLFQPDYSDDKNDNHTTNNNNHTTINTSEPVSDITQAVIRSSLDRNRSRTMWVEPVRYDPLVPDVQLHRSDSIDNNHTHTNSNLTSQPHTVLVISSNIPQPKATFKLSDINNNIDVSESPNNNQHKLYAVNNHQAMRAKLQNRLNQAIKLR